MSKMQKHSKDSKKPISNIELRRSCIVPLRNIPNPCTVIRHPITENDLGDELTDLIYTETNKENNGNYDRPILNSILTLGQQIEAMRLDRAPMRTICTEDLSPRSKAVVIPKISQKLNFPHDTAVFRNLIPINVNDCNLLPKKKTSLRKKYINHKIPAPDLGDFLDPLPPLEHTIPEPDINLIYGSGEIDVFEEFLEFYKDVNPRWIKDESQI